MTIKEFIEANPKAQLDLLTPGGYVFLTSERSRALLNGESVAGNNGFGEKENEMEIDARSLLAQTILDVGRPTEGDIWHFLTGYPEESSLPEDADPMKRLQTRLAALIHGIPNSRESSRQTAWLQPLPERTAAVAATLAVC